MTAPLHPAGLLTQEKADELVRDAKRPLEELTTQQRENIALPKEKLDLNTRCALRWSEIQGDKIELEGVRTKNDEPHTSRGCWRASRLGWDPSCFCERRGANLDNHTSV
jgi:hypothetical protein